MNPVLKKLNRTLSRSEIAAVLEKHIGADPSNYSSRQAYDACLARCSEQIANELKQLHDAQVLLSDASEDVWSMLLKCFIKSLST